MGDKKVVAEPDEKVGEERMTKEELLVDLSERVVRLGAVEKVPDVGKEAEGVTWYKAGIYVKKGVTALVRKNIHFYVMDEGQSVEKAFYMDQVPVSGVDFDAMVALDDYVSAQHGVVKVKNQRAKYLIAQLVKLSGLKKVYVECIIRKVGDDIIEEEIEKGD